MGSFSRKRGQLVQPKMSSVLRKYGCRLGRERGHIRNGQFGAMCCDQSASVLNCQRDRLLALAGCRLGRCTAREENRRKPSRALHLESFRWVRKSYHAFRDGFQRTEGQPVASPGLRLPAASGRCGGRTPLAHVTLVVTGLLLLRPRRVGGYAGAPRLAAVRSSPRLACEIRIRPVEHGDGSPERAEETVLAAGGDHRAVTG